MSDINYVKFLMVSNEDYEMREYVKNKIFSGRCVNDIYLKKPIRPMNFVFKKMSETQQKLFVMLKKNVEEDCPVCYTNVNYKTKITTDCNHVYCTDCFRKWINYSLDCPYCRSEVHTYRKHFYNSTLSYVVWTVSFNPFVKPFYSRYPNIR